MGLLVPKPAQSQENWDSCHQRFAALVPPPLLRSRATRTSQSDLHLPPCPLHLCEGSSGPPGLPLPIIPASPPAWYILSSSSPHCPTQGKQAFPKDQLYAHSSPWGFERKTANASLMSSKRLREAKSPQWFQLPGPPLGSPLWAGHPTGPFVSLSAGVLK